MVCIKTPQGADSDDTMATTRDDTMATARDDTRGADSDDTMATALRGVLTKLSIPQWTNH